MYLDVFNPPKNVPKCRANVTNAKKIEVIQKRAMFVSYNTIQISRVTQICFGISKSTGINTKIVLRINCHFQL